MEIGDRLLDTLEDAVAAHRAYERWQWERLEFAANGDGYLRELVPDAIPA